MYKNYFLSKTIFLLFSLVLITLLANPVIAQDSLLINYQGRLSDGGGEPLNGTVELTFGIYATPIGISLIWSETHQSVEVDDGLFNVILGSETTLPDTVFNGDKRYLGITVGIEPELSPRTLLTSVPYAAYAKNMNGDVETGSGHLHLNFPDSSLAVSISSDDGGNIKLFPPPGYLMVDTTFTIGSGFLFKDAPGGSSSRFGDLRSFFRMFNSPSGSSELAYELVADPFNGVDMRFYDDLGQIMSLGSAPTTGASIRLFNPQPEPPAKVMEISTNSNYKGELGSGISMYSVDPGDDGRQILEISNTISNGASIRLFNPQPEPPAKVMEISTNSNYKGELGSGISMYSVDPGDDGRQILEISNTISNGASIRLFNPQPEPPAKLFEINANANDGASLDIYDEIGKVMGFEPTPFSQGYSINLTDPSTDEKLVDIFSGFGAKGSSGEINVSDANLESNLTPAKLVLRHKPGMIGHPSIYMDATSDQVRVGIGTDNPSEPLVIGTDLGSYYGEMIVVGNSDAGRYSGIKLGENADNNGSMAWSNNNNYLYFVTKSEGISKTPLVLNGDLVGINTNSPTEALYVAGNIYATGTITELSDADAKMNVETIDNALDMIDKLHGVRYNLRPEIADELNATDDRQIGLIAQEVEQVLPEIVNSPQEGYKSVDYSRLTAVLVEAVKELKAENEQLKTRIDALEH